jgi:hypothetical protein
MQIGLCDTRLPFWCDIMLLPLLSMSFMCFRQLNVFLSYYHVFHFILIVVPLPCSTGQILAEAGAGLNNQM